MKNRLGMLAVLLAAMSAQAGTQQDKPALQEFVAEYKVEKGGFDVARATFKLNRTQEGIYRFTSESHAVGLLSVFVDDVVREESLFHVNGGEMQPVSYRYRHENTDKNRNQSIDYDWVSGTAHLNYRGAETDVQLEPGTIDRFLLQLAVARDLENDSLDRQYKIVDNGRVKKYQLKTTGTKNIETPAGDFEALAVERVDDDLDKQIRFWLAPELDYLPVRMEQSKKNEEPIRMTLVKVTQKGS